MARSIGEAGLRARRRGTPSTPITRWRGHHQRAGALGVVELRPRAAVLHGGCAGRPKHEGSSPDRAGDIEAEEELWLGGAPTTMMASGGPRRSAMHTAGQRERER
jgi:hypothetical protein